MYSIIVHTSYRGIASMTHPLVSFDGSRLLLLKFVKIADECLYLDTSLAILLLLIKLLQQVLTNSYYNVS